MQNLSLMTCLCLGSILLLQACHVGPDFVSPPVPEVTTYTKATPNLTPNNDEPSQRLVVGKEIPALWWQLFRSPALNQVVEQAIQNSPTIEQARARLAKAQQSILMARGSFYPQFDTSFSAQREKGPPLIFGLVPANTVPPYNLYSLELMVSFVPDVFGTTARQVEQQTALAENQAYQLAAAQLSVTGNVVIEALTLASVRQQIRIMEEIIADDEKNLALVQQRLSIGTIDRSDLLVVQHQLEEDRAILPYLKQQMTSAQDALAILVGKAPAAWEAPHFELDEFHLPVDLPLVLPSDFVSQRPDILAAEAQLHASSAAIGVAVGNLFPQITLSSYLSPTAITPGALFNKENLAWDALAGISAPIFHGGTLRAQKQAAIEEFHAAMATYQKTVLEGLRQVATTLNALGHDAELVRAERRAFDASNEALSLENGRLSIGTIDKVQWLDTSRNYQQARLSLTRARAQRYLDSAQLLVAMGGGGIQYFLTSDLYCAI